jgi:hypothetical protein
VKRFCHIFLVNGISVRLRSRATIQEAGMRWRTVVWLGALALGACNPYQNFSGEFYAGPIDPVNFQKPYLGGGDPKMGGGMFAGASVFASDKSVLFYFFPATMGVDPTDLTQAPIGYVFDPVAGTNAFPSPSRCVAPPNYTFDLRTMAYRLDEQGPIFTDLPSDSTYVPVIAEVPVTSNGEACQSIKSEKTLVASTDVSLQLDAMGKHGVPDGNFLAWALIDPGANVTPDDPNTFFGVTEHWGWFGRFLGAFIDGGYVPSMMGPMGTPVAVTQTVYVVDPNDSMGMPVMGADPMGNPGSGLDVIEHARGETGYSPICQVRTYTATNAADLPTNVAAVMMKGTLDPVPMTGPVFAYCLGVPQ